MCKNKFCRRILPCILALVIVLNYVIIDYLRNDRESIKVSETNTNQTHIMQEENVALSSDEEKAEACLKELRVAVDTKNTKEIESLTAKLEESLCAYDEEIAESLEISQAYLNEIQSDVLQTRQDEFIKSYEEKSRQAKELIESLKENPDSPEIAAKLEEYIGQPEEHNPLGNTLPYNPIENEPQEEALGSGMSASVNTYDYEKNAIVLPVEPQPEDLQIASETEMTKEMEELAKKLETPLAVYEYIRNNIDYRTYYGSRKGAIATFEQKSGNDTDQASLLIAMLRYLDYPARYITGTVELSKEQAMALTATDNIIAASKILAAQGRPVVNIVEGGNITAVQIEQTWVEVYTAYENYRGVGETNGKKVWVPLDASFKTYEKTEGIADFLKETEISLEDLKKTAAVADVEAQTNMLTQIQEKLQPFLEEDIVLNNKKIVSEDLNYLPLSLPYNCLSIQKEKNFLTETESDTISFIVDQTTLGTYKSADLYGKKIVMDYIPASEADSELLSKYGSVMETPAYLLSLKVVLRIDGEIIAQGPEITAGKLQSMTMKVSSGTGMTTVQNTIKSGSLYQITMDMDQISATDLQNTYQKAVENADSITEENVYSDEYLGTLLDVAGKMYFAQLDVSNYILSQLLGVSDQRSLSVGMTGYSLTTEYRYGLPYGVSEGNLFIDVDLDAHSAVTLSGDKESERAFHVASGMMASGFEDIIWEEMTGEESISTMKILEEAKAQNMEILMISRANADTELSKLSVSSGVYNDIKTAVQSGKVVTVPKDTMTIGEWTGSGYIIMDATTGAAGYMISGGLAGGSTSAYVNLAYLVDIGFSVWDMVESFLLIVSAITAIAAGGGIVGVALLIAGIVCLLFSAYAYIHSIMLMCAYMEGDEEAGKELVKDMWINIGVTIGTFALRTIAKPIISKVLKNKLVREFGQEFVDKLLKNTDDITTAGRAIKRLRKLNVGDDVIRELGERFGQKGYDWLLNKQNLKLSDDIIKKLMKTDNFMSYSDDLLRAIQKSNGYADDIIRQVEKYGDDVADAIAKYGDDAADVINQYGDDAVDSLKEGKTPDEVRAARGNNKTGTIWDNIIGTADNIPGTEIPATFQINLDGKINYVNPETGTNTLWTNANATEHMGEYVSRFGDESWSIGVRSQAMLESYAASLDEAMEKLIQKEPGVYFDTYGNWELGINTETGVVYHALMVN